MEVLCSRRDKGDNGRLPGNALPDVGLTKALWTNLQRLASSASSCSSWGHGRVLQQYPAGRDESTFPTVVWMRQRSCGKRCNSGTGGGIVMCSQKSGGAKMRKKRKGGLTLDSCLVLKVCFDGMGWDRIGREVSCLTDANISLSCEMCGVQPLCLKTRL